MTREKTFYEFVNINNSNKKKGKEVTMFEKILYPTDFSDASKKALGYIKSLKDAGAKKVIVLHVIDEREIDHIAHLPEVSIDIKELEKKREEHAKKEIGAMEKELKEAGFTVKTIIKKGIPFTDILKEEEDVSVVVIGSHGKSCISEMLLGSVSEKVIRKSSKPVLVVRR
jgi:nucleotide-binding universal stress UspA family protein